MVHVDVLQASGTFCCAPGSWNERKPATRGTAERQIRLENVRIGHSYHVDPKLGYLEPILTP